MKHIPLFTAVLLLAACATGNYIQMEDFTIDHRSPSIEIGNVDVQFDSLMSLGGLRKREMVVSYFPVEDAVCLQYRIDFHTYNQFWSKKGRETFISAVAEYKEDFSQRRLKRNSRSNKKNYGIIKSFLMWQASNYTARYNGHPDIEIGYYFKEKSPFFTINQRGTNSVGTSSSDTRATQDIMLLFTIAQAEELAALFDPWFLRGLIMPNFGSSAVEYDEY